MDEVKYDRRTFLISSVAFAGGMSLSLVLLPDMESRAMNSADPSPAGDTGAELSPWVAIAPDDTVIVRSPTGEIGNGSMTQVAMNVTEELGCDWSKVRVESASARRDYLEGGVYSKGALPFFAGHGTDPDRTKYALQVGASARERLKAAAAARWNIPSTEIQAANSILTHKSTGRMLRYGDVAAEAAAIKLESEPALKPQSEWIFLGKASPPKLSLPAIVKGAAVYGIDVNVPGMVHAALRQSPVHGGKLRHHDPGAVMKMPGVRAVVVVDPSKTKGSPVTPKATFGLADSLAQSAVAVIADHYWQAKKALDALPVEWDNGAGEQWRSTEQIYEAAIAALDKSDSKVLHATGDVNAVKAATIVEATYVTPYCDNAAMEPLNGTALVTADRVEVWHPCQDPQQAFWVAVDETGKAPENVELHQTLVGGAFGRRVLANDVRMVVAIAKEHPGVPVKVIWSREEMTRQGRYRSLIASRFRAGLDGKGMPLTYKAEACVLGLPSTIATLPLAATYGDTPYVVSGVIPNVKVSVGTLPIPILTGAYRGPCYNSYAFMVDTFIDECAIAAKVDPLDYRLRLLAGWDSAWSTCLKVAADKVGWGKPLQKGQGCGIAISSWPLSGQRQAGSIVCAAAKVQVSREGVLMVMQIDIAFDCGRVANRDAVVAQIQGGVIFALNTTLNEEITIKDGAVVEGNFDQYPILRMREIPSKINVHFDALSGHDRFAIIGEAPVGPIGAAVGNAIFRATGKRLRTTPFRKHDLSWA